MKNNHRRYHMTDITIVGRGAFGTYMEGMLSMHGARITDCADIVLLAVPASSIKSAAADNPGKFLVNVCSIQSTTNDLCLESSERVLGLHPLFGSRSPNGVRKTAILTLHSTDSETEKIVTGIFRKFSDIIDEKPDGRPITAIWHDQLMADSHMAAINIAIEASEKLKKIKNIPDMYLPTSVVKLRELTSLLQDMPKGTMESIMANPFC